VLSAVIKQYFKMAVVFILGLLSINSNKYFVGSSL